MGAGDAVVLVPVKAFAQAKQRLSGVLTPHERAALAQQMAEHVVHSARPLPVAVVCDDPGVAAWAEALGATVLPEPGLGLNGAVEAAVDALEARGVKRVIVAHADLPLAGPLEWLAGVRGIVIVPDRRQQGTNVISLPPGCGLRFCYGPGSFQRHLAEAGATGLQVQVVNDPALGWDVDLPADMAAITR